MSFLGGIEAVARAAAALVLRDPHLTEVVTYKRITGTDFDPASQTSQVTTEETQVRAVPLEQTARPGAGQAESRELCFLIHVRDLAARPAVGDFIVRGQAEYEVVRAEKDTLGLVHQVFVRGA